MGKRKLRNCSNCGSRHGPPTGKNCGNAEAKPRKEDEVSTAEPNHGAAAMFDRSEEEIAQACAAAAAGQETDEDLADFTLSGDEDVFDPGEAFYSDTRPKSPAGSGARCAIYLHQQMKSMQKERVDFEKRVEGRMIYMENLLGKVAGVQQAQLQRLVDLTAEQAKGARPAPPAAPTAEPLSSSPSTTSPTLEKPQASAGTPKGQVPYVFNMSDFSDTAVPESDEDWKSYHGYAAWHLENEKSKKNPFDHQAFIKKGDKIASVEDLMAVTFKTLNKLVEKKADVRGLISHGLFMSEKAAKNVFVSEAFVAYDECVRKRAGESGPSAFGQVLQEEVFAHFCYENTKKQRALSKDKAKPARSKSDKACLRYNDAGCTTKTCLYAHKCQTCDGYGHSKKNCGNTDKKKEGK